MQTIRKLLLADAIAGAIPAYTVSDVSASLRLKNWNVKLGVNNLTDARYFTLRTSEYPAPELFLPLAEVVTSASV